MIVSFICGFFTGIFIIIIAIMGYVLYKATIIYKRLINDETVVINEKTSKDEPTKTKQETFAISLKQSMKNLFNI